VERTVVDAETVVEKRKEMSKKDQSERWDAELISEQQQKDRAGWWEVTQGVDQ